MIDLKGHAAIRDFVGRFSAQQAAGVQFRHMVTNVAARIDGERARERLTRTDQPERRAPEASAGSTSAISVKQDGAWRFNRRTVFHDHEYSLER